MSRRPARLTIHKEATIARTIMAILAAGVVALTPQASAAEHARLTNGDEITSLNGKCVAVSGVAEGPAEADLTERLAPFACDGAAIVLFQRDPGHMFIQFGEKRSTTPSVIGFGGYLDDDGGAMDVTRMYLTVKQPIEINDGACRFFFKGDEIQTIYCLGILHRAGRRKMAAITFKVSPGQRLR